jgi:hypothetical protein
MARLIGALFRPQGLVSQLLGVKHGFACATPSKKAKTIRTP